MDGSHGCCVGVSQPSLHGFAVGKARRGYSLAELWFLLLSSRGGPTISLKNRINDNRANEQAWQLSTERV